MNPSFGLYLRRLRRKEEKTLRDLSVHTGITCTDLQRLEGGTIVASREQVFRLARYFDFDEQEFLRINQADRITQEVTGSRKKHLKQACSAVFKNSSLASKRIINMTRDLALLETRPVRVKLHTPGPDLQPFIESIVYCKGHNLGHTFETILPDGTSQLQLVIGESGRELVADAAHQAMSLTRAWLICIHDVPVTFRLSEATETIYVRFKPAGLYAFTGIHQNELNNKVMDANLIFGHALEILWERLANCKEPAEMVLRIENFFFGRLNPRTTTQALLTYMLDQNQLPLRQLAKKAGYSAQYLTRTFQKYIGIGPKSFQRTQRFNSAITMLTQSTERVDWPGIFFRNNYHDQAHFIKDFKHFSGLTPQQYLSLGASCTRYLHSPLPPV